MDAPFIIGAARRGLTVALLLALALVFLIVKEPLLAGDLQEYTLLTVAIANHASPDIRPDDIAAARVLVPGLAASLDQLRDGIAAGLPMPTEGFFRSLRGDIHAIHFFAYSALAALPFKLLQAAGLPPLKCFQVVNLGFVLVLALALLRQFGNGARALAGVALFMLCGGALYLNWTSPEIMSASALLAALLLYTSGAPVRAGLLGGLAALQNPTIMLFFAFAPLLALIQARLAGQDWRAALAPRQLMRLAPGVALLLLFPLFNYYQFGVPSVIAKLGTDPKLISLVRLHSFYFDLNQGMLVGIPALALTLLLWRGRAGAPGLAMLLAAALMTLALALPTLAVHNWNSGAAGVMRYAVWAAMPLLFTLLWQLGRYGPALRWPRAMLAALALAQGAAMLCAVQYNHIEFSELAALALRHAPGAYNPEPEIFAERASGFEMRIDPQAIYRYGPPGAPIKTLYNRANLDADVQLCGAGRALAAQPYTETSEQWRYIDGPPRCGPAGPPAVRYALPQFRQGDALKLGTGWSVPEGGGGMWDGVWSDQAHATLTLTPPPGRTFTGLLIIGRYYDGNSRTRVSINGADLGWQRLNELPLLPLPTGTAAARLTIELEFDHPRQPPASQPDQRKLAFFLQQIAIQ